MAKPPKPQPPQPATCSVQVQNDTGGEMTINVQQGASIKFVTQFKDSSGGPITPASANIALTYNASGSATTTTLPLTRQGSDWTAWWGSGVADIGLVNWAVSSNITVNPVSVGKLSVVPRVTASGVVMVTEQGALSY